MQNATYFLLAFSAIAFNASAGSASQHNRVPRPFHRSSSHVTTPFDYSDFKNVPTYYHGVHSEVNEDAARSNSLNNEVALLESEEEIDPEPNNEITAFEGAVLRQDLEDAFLPNPDETYLAPGEKVREVVEWGDGNLEVLDDRSDYVYRPQLPIQNSVHTLRDDRNILMSDAMLVPQRDVHDSSSYTDHVVNANTAKIAAGAVLKMMTRDCVIGDKCGDNRGCCIDHRCVGYSAGGSGVCLPRCKSVTEGGSCSSCPCESGLECAVVSVNPYQQICKKPPTIGLPCSDNNQCNPGECCLMGRRGDDTIARCQSGLSAFQSCPQGHPHPFMNVFIGACPCDHHSGLLCIEGICDWRV
ncbi:uncharacterized protein LOC100371386 [Saccoglossus kowalevskii]|uniref:Uncharacterized protein LOC100371386 n=1 Tax=Saccoglossus kowalevskii TaxID=10224 RepID=A0ABM0H0G2_SACKO|nr:PREDICTED: uncharacterized protein LOC100371386 [Saccoglossus kowalevskii]